MKKNVSATLVPYLKIGNLIIVCANCVQDQLTPIVVLPVRTILLHLNVASGPEPSRLAPALPLHGVVGLALPVPVAVARAALKGAVLAVPAFNQR